MSHIASMRGLFGGNCGESRVLEEMGGYSDLQLHNFAGVPGGKGFRELYLLAGKGIRLPCVSLSRIAGIVTARAGTCFDVVGNCCQNQR